MRMKERNQAVLLMLLSALSFSLMQVAVKISAMSVGTLQQVFCRNLISLFIALILLRKKHLPLLAPGSISCRCFCGRFSGL